MTGGWLVDRPIAHRGLHEEDIPENSLDAFRAAIDAGYPIELDVNLTADGVPIVYHHPSETSTAPDDDPIRRARWHEFREEGNDRVPRFRVALEVIDGRVPLLIDIKNWHRNVGEFEDVLIDRLDRYDGDFAVQSFNPATLAYFRRHRPEWPRGQIAEGFAEADTLSRIERAVLKRLMLIWWSRPDFVAYRHTDLPYWPVRLHRGLGLPVLAWTVRSAAQRARVDPYCDNVIFESFRP